MDLNEEPFKIKEQHQIRMKAPSKRAAWFKIYAWNYGIKANNLKILIDVKQLYQDIVLKDAPHFIFVKDVVIFVEIGGVALGL
jgi:hypothetical protein